MCFQANSNLNYFVSCTSAAAVALNPSQDGMVGLDVTNPDNSDGKLGFSYTKIAANGNELPANATSWACVKDKVTGLMWENKTAANAPLTYTNWGDNRAGDASLFVAQSQGLCGFSNWRLPSLDELQGIVDYSVPYAGPSIDIGYFQYTQSNWYWSSSPDPGSRGNGAGIVYFSFGAVDYDQYRDGRGPVRLVRSGQ